MHGSNRRKAHKPAGQLLALLHRDGHARGRLNEQVILSQEASEQHTVPVFVGAFVDEPVDGLCAAFLVEHVAQLPAMGAKPIAQGPLLRRHGAMWLVMVDSQRSQRRSRTGFGSLSRIDDDLIKLLSQVVG